MKGYMMILPAWYSKLEKKLEKLVKDFAIDNKIDFILTEDSRNIQDAIRTICDTMHYIKKHVKEDE